MTYVVRAADTRPEMKGTWDSPFWRQADTLGIAHFRPESGAYHPRTRARLLHDAGGVSGIFRVEDRYVPCVTTDYLGPVWKDSCVEFFVQPKPDKGYFNFEFNCGGTLLCYYVVDPTRVPGGFKDFVPLSEADVKRVSVYHSLPRIVEPEIAEPTDWVIEFFIPFELLEKQVGPVVPVRGQEWRANFYKCAEDNSHPHWASWQPIDELNFHRPRCFGAIRFE